MENGNFLIKTEFGYAQNKYFKRNIYIENGKDFLTEKKRFIDEHNTGSCDLYQCIYTIFNDVDNGKDYYLGNLCIDFDTEIKNNEEYKKLTFEVKKCINFLNSFFSLDYDNYKIYFSGHKGFHLVIPYQIFGIKPSETLNISYKNFVMKLIKECNLKYVDLKIYDNRRLFRIPNTLNTKSNLYKVQINIDQLYDFTLEDILKYANKQQKTFEINQDFNLKAQKAYEQYIKTKTKIKLNNNKKIIITEKKELLPCASNLLNNGADEGNRNNSTIALTSSLLQAGFDEEEVYETIYSWNDLNNPPLPVNEIRATIKSAIKLMESGRIYGCSAYKTLGACIGKNCKLLK